MANTLKVINFTMLYAYPSRISLSIVFFFFFFSHCVQLGTSVTSCNTCLVFSCSHPSLNEMERRTSVAVRNTHFFRQHLSICSSRSSEARKLLRRSDRLQISPSWTIVKTFCELDSSQTEVV